MTTSNAWLASTLVAAIACGCASEPSVGKDAIVGQPAPGSEPPIHKLSSANVGEVMYRQSEVFSGVGAQLQGEGEFRTSVLFGEVRLTPTTALLEQEEADYPTYCTQTRVYTRFGKDQASDIACFADDDRDGWFDRVQVPSVKFGSWTDSDGPRYATGPMRLQSSGGQQLIYLGRTDNSIKVGYRQLDENGQVGASQTVEYALGLSQGATEVGFRQLRMRIDSATNSEVRYEVLRGF